MRSTRHLLAIGRPDLLGDNAWKTIGAGAGYIQTHEASKQLTLELRIKAFIKWLRGNSDALPDIEMPVILTKTDFAASRRQQMEEQLAELFKQVDADAARLNGLAAELAETHAEIKATDAEIEAHLADLPDDVHPEATAAVEALRRAHVDCVVPQPPTTEDSSSDDAEATARGRADDFNTRYERATQAPLARLRELPRPTPAHSVPLDRLLGLLMRRAALVQHHHATVFRMQETATVIQARMGRFHVLMTSYRATYSSGADALAARLAELAGGLPGADDPVHPAPPALRSR